MTAREFAIELRRFAAWLVTALAAGYVIAYFVSLPFGGDDSDPEGWGARSGLVVRIDHATSCEYLVAPQGGLVPRQDSRGNHRGCKP